MTKQRGFTLVELMMALVILGLLTALVIPVVKGNTPSRNRMMMKKAYYTIESIVRDLINNEEYYPELGSDGNTYVGFDNTLNACGALVGEDKEGSARGGVLNNTCEGKYKFPKLFAKQLNVRGDMRDVGVSHSAEGDMYVVDSGGVSFNTTDGMNWRIESIGSVPAEVSNVELGDTIVNQILVDVNGDKAPNCYQGLASCASRTKDFDQFKVYVSTRGKVVPASGQTWFENAISIDSSVNGD